MAKVAKKVVKRRRERKNIEKGFLLPLISPEYRFCVQTNEEMEYIAKNNAEDIAKLQNIVSWVIRAVIGAVISAVMAFILIK